MSFIRNKNALASFDGCVDNGIWQLRLAFRQFSAKIQKSRIRTSGHQYFSRQCRRRACHFDYSVADFPQWKKEQTEETGETEETAQEQPEESAS